MSSQSLTSPRDTMEEFPVAPNSSATSVSALDKRSSEADMSGGTGDWPARMSPATVDGVFDPMRNEFDYHPVPVIAPVTLFLGLASFLGLFNLVGLAISLAGSVLGFFAVRQIVRSRGELGGKWIAMTGLSLSVILLVGGGASHVYAYQTELPEGYKRVNFTHDIAKKGFVSQDGETLIHPDVRQLDERKIFLKGYMYPERQSTGLTQFVLVKDNLQCCFGGQPQLTDMILVEMAPGVTVDYTTSLVSVSGVFEARAPQQAGSLMTVYKMDECRSSVARTSF